jgi:hypothetical protein
VLAVERPWRFESSPGHHPIEQGFNSDFTAAEYSSSGPPRARAVTTAG